MIYYFGLLIVIICNNKRMWFLHSSSSNNVNQVFWQYFSIKKLNEWQCWQFSKSKSWTMYTMNNLSYLHYFILPNHSPTEWKVILYPWIIPFCPSTNGGSHDMCKLWAVRTEHCTFSGGSVGASSKVLDVTGSLAGPDPLLL